MEEKNTMGKKKGAADPSGGGVSKPRMFVRVIKGRGPHLRIPVSGRRKRKGEKTFGEGCKLFGYLGKVFR